MTDREMLQVAIDQAKLGLSEGGIPIGAALFDANGNLLGSGRNRRVQQNDPSIHGETDAFRNAGRVGFYGNTTMVSTLAPCWYCSGLIRQFGIGRVIVGEAQNFDGGHNTLRDISLHLMRKGPILRMRKFEVLCLTGLSLACIKKLC